MKINPVIRVYKLEVTFIMIPNKNNNNNNNNNQGVFLELLVAAKKEQFWDH